MCIRDRAEVVDEEAEVLGGVAWCVQGLDADAAQGEAVLVLQFLVREGGLEGLALVVGGDGQRCAAALGEFLGPGGEVGVDVGLQDMGDAHALLVSVVEVDVDVAARIDDG